MDLNIQITDMAGAGIEHSMVIMNFCTMAFVQLKENKKELKLLHFPHLDMDFDELFNLKW